MLNARFYIIATLGHSFSYQELNVVMCACFILYNMIIEDERGELYDVDDYETVESSIVACEHQLSPLKHCQALQPSFSMRLHFVQAQRMINIKII